MDPLECPARNCLSLGIAAVQHSPQRLAQAFHHPVSLILAHAGLAHQRSSGPYRMSANVLSNFVKRDSLAGFGFQYHRGSFLPGHEVVLLSQFLELYSTIGNASHSPIPLKYTCPHLGFHSRTARDNPRGAITDCI